MLVSVLITEESSFTFKQNSKEWWVHLCVITEGSSFSCKHNLHVKVWTLKWKLVMNTCTVHSRMVIFLSLLTRITYLTWIGHRKAKGHKPLTNWAIQKYLIAVVVLSSHLYSLNISINSIMFWALFGLQMVTFCSETKTTLVITFNSSALFQPHLYCFLCTDWNGVLRKQFPPGPCSFSATYTTSKTKTKTKTKRQNQLLLLTLTIEFQSVMSSFCNFFHSNL